MKTQNNPKRVPKNASVCKNKCGSNWHYNGNTCPKGLNRRGKKLVTLYERQKKDGAVTLDESSPTTKAYEKTLPATKQTSPLTTTQNSNPTTTLPEPVAEALINFWNQNPPHPKIHPPMDVNDLKHAPFTHTFDASKKSHRWTVATSNGQRWELRSSPTTKTTKVKEVTPVQHVEALRATLGVEEGTYDFETKHEYGKLRRHISWLIATTDGGEYSVSKRGKFFRVANLNKTRNNIIDIKFKQ